MKAEQSKKEIEIPVEASTEPEYDIKEKEEYKIKSEDPAEASTDQDSKKLAAETPAEASTDQDSKKKALETPAEASTDQDSNKKAAETPTKASTDQDSNKKAAETPVEASTDQDSTNKAAKTPAEASTDQDSYEKAAETPAEAPTDQDSYKKAAEALVEASTNQDSEKKATEIPAEASTDQDSYKKAAEALVEASTNQDSEKKAAETPAKASTDQDSYKKAAETLVEASTNQASEKKAAETPAEASMRPESSRKETPKSLKSKTRTAKKSNSCNFVNTSKKKRGLQAQLKQENKKHCAFKGDKESSNNEEDLKLKSREEGKGKNIINGECKDENRHPQKDREKIIKLEKCKRRQGEKRKRSKLDSSIKNQRTRENHDGMEKGKKKEKLGGLIFMCSAKTKPDCFHYRVMGVSMSKKELVMGVKPGLTIFLYDFDLKLLYGIYKASSYGGMKLEPRAFGGAFPVQVRFSIKKDCLPLPENVFKKAIKENYNRRHKFKTELTIKQVRKLTDLFRPIDVHSAMRPILSPQVPRVQSIEVHERLRETWPHSHMETLDRDSLTNDPSLSYPRVQHIEVHERLREARPHSRIETLDRDSLTNDPSVSFPRVQHIEVHERLREARPHSHMETLDRDSLTNDPSVSYPRVQHIEVHERLREARPHSHMETLDRDSLTNDPSVSYPRVQHIEVHERLREARPHSHLETLDRNAFTNDLSVSYPLLSHERDHLRIAHRDMRTIQREETPRVLYLTEEEYRAFGLPGERRNLTPSSHIAPNSETYWTDYEMLHLRQPDPTYRSAVSSQRETIQADPCYLNEKEYQAYGLVARHELPSAAPIAAATSATALSSHAKDPYHAYDAPNLIRNEVSSGSYSIGRKYPKETAYLRQSEGDQGDALYSKYAANASSPYNQIQHYHGTRSEAATGSISSLQSEGHQVELLYSTYGANAPSHYNQIQHYHGTQPEAASGSTSLRYSFASPSFSRR